MLLAACSQVKPAGNESETQLHYCRQAVMLQVGIIAHVVSATQGVPWTCGLCGGFPGGM